MAQKSLSCSAARELRKLVDPGHPELSDSRQCALLGLPRSTLYYRPNPVRKSTLRIMARSIPFIWKTHAAVAVGWWAIWPEMGSRSAVPGCETSCGVWVYGRSTRNPPPRFQGIHPNVSPAWWISASSRLWIRCGPRTSPTSRCRKAFSIWLRSWTCSPDTC